MRSLEQVVAASVGRVMTGPLGPYVGKRPHEVSYLDISYEARRQLDAIGWKPIGPLPTGGPLLFLTAFLIPWRSGCIGSVPVTWAFRGLCRPAPGGWSGGHTCRFTASVCSLNQPPVDFGRSLNQAVQWWLR